jgi:hypothetical protein
MLNKSKLATGRLFVIASLLLLTSFNPLSSSQNVAKNSYYVFFDLGDVLLTTNGSNFFWDNFGSFLAYPFKHGVGSLKRALLKKRLFELMDHQSNLPRGTATNDNELLPGIMCEWMEGKISSEEFVATVTNIAPSDPFFKSKTEAAILLNMVRLMLPKQLVETHETTKMLKIFQACCKQDASRVCILSNWDKSSIPLLKAKFPQIFAKIKNNQIIFSGELGCKKPDADIYRLAASKIGVNPCRCVLVDDQAVNVAAARSCGWKGIVHCDKDETAEILNDFYGFSCVT